MFETPCVTNRSALFDRFSKEEIVERYRKNYRLSNDIGWEHVEQHTNLESQLTDELLSSTPESRVAIFEHAYFRLYNELPWLTGTGTHSGGEQWAALMRPGASVYEVGSG